jgi:hypothetical protein
MSPEQPLNRRFYEGPDVETLNILIELGEIVKHSEPIELHHVPADNERTRRTLLNTAAQAILGVKGLRRAAKRLQEPAPHRPYDFRLAVFREGGE